MTQRFMFQLEKYKGKRSRFTCPACGRKYEFARYVDDSGEYISDEVGRCNRESSCGYHLTPKEHFEARGVQCSFPERLNKLNKMNAVNAMNKMNTLNAVNAIEQFDTIDNSFVLRSLEHNEKNRFLIYLASFIAPEFIFEMAKKYLIGGTKDGRCVFWQIDQIGRARTGKIISYSSETGKRDKNVHPSWIHYELKRHKVLPESFQHQICFFGEHRLKYAAPDAPVAIVEAEKTSCIASVFLDDFIWLAVGGKSYLKPERLRRFKNRKIVLFPDADGFDLWEREAADARRLGLNVTTSRLIEDSATADERAAGFDLADYLIKGELAAQKHNARADSYNAKVDLILNSDELFQTFNEFLDERIAIMESEDAALKPENLRLIVEQIV